MPSASDLAKKELRGTSFANPYRGRGPAIFIGVFGLQKVGKTHFIKDAPGPIAYFGIDDGHRGVLDEDIERGHVLESSYLYPVVVAKKGESEESVNRRMKDAAGETWREIANDFQRVLDAPHIRTVVWDTGTEVYETLVLSRNARLTEIAGLERGKMKRILGGMMRSAIRSGKNFIWLAKETSVWKGGAPTTKVQAAGFSELGYYAEVIIHLTKDRKPSGRNVYTGEIVDCRFQRSLEGEKLDAPTFIDVACTVRPDVDDEDWTCEC